MRTPHFKVFGVLLMTLLTVATQPSNNFDDGAYIKSQEEKNRIPKYSYSTAVHDDHTMDIKRQSEQRNGDVTEGEYSFLEADGTLRTVKYYVKGNSGFVASVQNVMPKNKINPLIEEQQFMERNSQSIDEYNGNIQKEKEQDSTPEEQKIHQTPQFIEKSIDEPQRSKRFLIIVPDEKPAPKQHIRYESRLKQPQNAETNHSHFLKLTGHQQNDRLKSEHNNKNEEVENVTNEQNNKFVAENQRHSLPLDSWRSSERNVNSKHQNYNLRNQQEPQRLQGTKISRPRPTLQVADRNKQLQIAKIENRMPRNNQSVEVNVEKQELLYLAADNFTSNNHSQKQRTPINNKSERDHNQQQQVIMRHRDPHTRHPIRKIKNQHSQSHISQQSNTEEPIISTESKQNNNRTRENENNLLVDDNLTHHQNVTNNSQNKNSTRIITMNKHLLQHHIPKNNTNFHINKPGYKRPEQQHHVILNHQRSPPKIHYHLTPYQHHRAVPDHIKHEIHITEHHKSGKNNKTTFSIQQHLPPYSGTHSQRMQTALLPQKYVTQTPAVTIKKMPQRIENEHQLSPYLQPPPI